MPIHDWTKVDAGWFHDFHQTWSIEIKRVLNCGILPEGVFAFIEQKTEYGRKRIPRRKPDEPRRFEPDVLALQISEVDFSQHHGGTMVVDRPQTRLVQHVETDQEHYARRANRISIHKGKDRVVAVVEIVSPGHKHSKRAFEKFLGKTTKFLDQGIHVLLLDLFPPTPRDPQGVHHADWDRYSDEIAAFSREKPLTLVGYSAGEELQAFIEPVAMGDALPLMPLFITPEKHVKVPLEESYMAAWDNTSLPVKQKFEA